MTSPRDRGIDFAGRLDGLDAADFLAGLGLVAGLRQFDERQVAELFLGELGDADNGFVTFDSDPFVGFRVEKFLGIHACLQVVLRYVDVGQKVRSSP